LPEIIGFLSNSYLLEHLGAPYLPSG